MSFLDKTASEYASLARTIQSMISAGADRLPEAQTKALEELYRLVTSMTTLASSTAEGQRFPLYPASLRTVLAYRLAGQNGNAQLHKGIDALHACLENDGFCVQTMVMSLLGDGTSPPTDEQIEDAIKAPKRHAEPVPSAAA
jgi:hypothetical protein